MPDSPMGVFHGCAGSCILFGDGSGAVLMEATDGPCAMLGFRMHSDGNGQKSLNCNFDARDNFKPMDEGTASSLGAYRNVHMIGQDVYKFAVKSVPTVIDEALEVSGLQKSDVDWLVMHQANQRIMDACAARLELPKGVPAARLSLPPACL
eukprot:353961-Chlamydomonas_euryale.AAC.1